MVGEMVGWSEKRGSQEGVRVGATSTISTKKGQKDNSFQDRFLTMRATPSEADPLRPHPLQVSKINACMAAVSLKTCKNKTISHVLML